MPSIQQNAFTTVLFTEEEMKEAVILPPLFRLFLLSLRGEIALKKIALKLEPEKMYEFAQNEAFFAGQIELLNQLLGD